MIADEMKADAVKVGTAPEAKAPAQPAKRPAPPQSQMVEKVQAAATKALYAKRETVEGILKMIQSAKRPEIGIARAAFNILEQIKEKMKNMNPRLASAAAPALIAEIVRIAVQAGVIQKDKGIVERAAQILMQELRRPQGQQAPQARQAQPAQPAAPAANAQPPMGDGGMISNMMGG